MTFEDKVKFLRSLPQFRVIPLSEVRAIAFAARSVDQHDSIVLGESGSNALYLNEEDIGKLVREYPDLASKLK